MRQTKISDYFKSCIRFPISEDVVMNMDESSMSFTYQLSSNGRLGGIEHVSVFFNLLNLCFTQKSLKNEFCWIFVLFFNLFYFRMQIWEQRTAMWIRFFWHWTPWHVFWKRWEQPYVGLMLNGASWNARKSKHMGKECIEGEIWQLRESCLTLSSSFQMTRKNINFSRELFESFWSWLYETLLWISICMIFVLIIRWIWFGSGVRELFFWMLFIQKRLSDAVQIRFLILSCDISW